MPEAEPSNGCAVFLSLLALAISIYAAVQSRRVADASERSILIAQEQTRPRLTFSSPSVVLDGAQIHISAVLLNRGNVPADVTSATFSTGGVQCDEHLTFPDIEHAIIDPNELRNVQISLPRLKIENGDVRDCSKDSPSRFGFRVSYHMHDHDDISFKESLSFSNLRWTVKAPAHAPKPLLFHGFGSVKHK